MEVPEENQEPNQEESERALEQHRDRVYHGSDVTMLEIVEPILAQQGDVLRVTRQAALEFVQPLFDEDAQQRDRD